MSVFNFDDIRYSELTTFLSVARTLNMTVSAAELHISQPAVSKRIERLESSHGMILFLRTSTGLQLTPAGRVFYKEISSSCKHIQQAFMEAASAQKAQVRTLRLAYDGFFDIPLLAEITTRFRKRYNADIKLYTDERKENCMDLFDGTADLMICPDSYFASIKEYVESEFIAAFRFSIIVSREHPLAQQETIGIPDLLGVPLTVARINADSPYVKTIQEMFQKYGFSPRLENYVTKDSLCFDLVTNRGVSLAAVSFWTRLNQRTMGFFNKNLRVCPLPDEFYPMYFAYKKGQQDPVIDGFLSVFREVVSEDNNREILDKAYE